jgi:chromosome segregation ATPase
LKTIIDGDQKTKSDLANEVEILRVEADNLHGEKQELFKMIEEIKLRQVDDLKAYKDRIIELENEMSTHNERVAQMEVELNYEKDYHSKCEFTIKELTDGRDKACKENAVLKGDLEKEREKVKDLSFEVEKNKTFKKEIEVLSLQLERVESSTKEYKREIE